MIVPFVLILVETNVVEDKKFWLRTKIGDVSDTGGFEIGFRFASDVARIASIIFLRNGINDVADEAQCRRGAKWIHDRRRGVRHDQHVRCVDCLPAADRRAVKAESCFKNLFLVFA